MRMRFGLSMAASCGAMIACSTYGAEVVKEDASALEPDSAAPTVDASTVADSAVRDAAADAPQLPEGGAFDAGAPPCADRTDNISRYCDVFPNATGWILNPALSINVVGGALRASAAGNVSPRADRYALVNDANKPSIGLVALDLFFTEALADGAFEFFELSDGQVSLSLERVSDAGPSAYVVARVKEGAVLKLPVREQTQYHLRLSFEVTRTTLSVNGVRVTDATYGAPIATQPGRAHLMFKYPALPLNMKQTIVFDNFVVAALP